MKKLFLAAISLLTITGFAQQLETYDSGLYSEIFHTNATAIFVFTNNVGLNGTRALQPLNTQYALNYLRRGSFDFSIANVTMQINTFFRVKNPTTTGIGNDALEMGFVQNQTSSSFISAGTNGAMSYWIYPVNTTVTNNGYQFQTTIDVNVYNGASSAGFGFGTIAKPILKTNNWYKATLLITRSSASAIDFLGTIDDYGTDGQAYLSTVDTIYFAGTTGSASYQFSYLTGDKSYYPALGGVNNFGLRVIDNTSCSGTFTTNIAASIQTDVELNFASTIGKKYYINSSPDLKQWTTIEIVTGTGATVTRYYQTTSSQKFFRVVQD